GVVAPRLAPQVRGLDGRHQELDRARSVLLLAHDLLDLLQNPKAERQPGINPRRGLTNQARTEHQLVAGDLRVGRSFLGDGQEIAGKAHQAFWSGLDEWLVTLREPPTHGYSGPWREPWVVLP